MSTAANKSLVRAFVEAWNAKDLDRFDDLMSQSCQLSVGGGPPEYLEWLQAEAGRLEAAGQGGA